MQSEQATCECSEHGYSPSCPNAFYQGGKILHAIESETKLKPRVYISSKETDSNDSQHALSGYDDEESEREKVMNSQVVSPITHSSQPVQPASLSSSGLDALYEEVRQNFPSHLSTEVAVRSKLGKGQLQNDDRMMEQNRKILRKYEPLNVGGQSLTGMSIGGFVVDLSRAAQKASEVAPLPPSKLPIIFADDDMNFHHHFFQGLDILLGKDIVQEIVSADKYYGQTELHLLPMIVEMIKAGYEKSDTEITVFTKKVLTSTFEVDPSSRQEVKDGILVVAANLWGFQYIESGMQMKEPDLKMWLQNCHRFYRTIWFNTFKSAGIPLFALDGVQTRYESPPGKKKAQQLQKEDCRRSESGEYRPEVPEHVSNEQTRSRHDRRRHRSRRQESSISNFFTGK